jgi:hypothetical protein
MCAPVLPLPVPLHHSASDDINHERVVEFIAVAREELGLTVVKYSDFISSLFEPFRHYPPDVGEHAVSDHNLFGQLEAIILSNAEFFIGTGGSTFTDLVLQLMLVNGRAKAGRRELARGDAFMGFTSALHADEFRPAHFRPPIAHSNEAERLRERFTLIHG